jgi:NitT/TauT family transport system permease protein
MVEPGHESSAGSAPAAASLGRPGPPARRHWFVIRRPVGPVANVALGLLCLLTCFALWWLSTKGDPNDPQGEVASRWINPSALPSPAETFATFPSLWKDRALLSNTYVTLRRVSLGFALAALVGIPLGVLAGCFPAAQSFLQPLVLFGRNIPIAALIPLTFFFFGISELQKVMFIFIACVAFVVADTASNIREIGQQYVDTAYTLGAKRWHVISKVLVPLAMPNVFDSMRILFGLAFGYIMLAETIRLAGEQGGLGNLIQTSQRIGPRAHIILIILIIPVVALVIDRLLFWCQQQLFPYRFGGAGRLRSAVRAMLGGWERVKGWFLGPVPPYDQLVVPEEAKRIVSVDPATSAEWRGRWRP